MSGVYCTGGRITGPCAAGYYCIVNNTIPNPDNSYRPDGGLCPYGYYCPEGNDNTDRCMVELVFERGCLSTHF